ncbi:MAG: HAD family hydrolase [Defluviitaleaceae bacterium]|nr:HAD family hydrolase [Defluviitaleaceae bacterium]
MYNLCLFDLDGTLTDPKVGITKSVKHALAHFGIEVPSLDALEKFIGPPLRDSFREFYGFTPEEAELAVAKYREYFPTKGIFENELYPGIMETLAKLQAHNITMAMATSKPTIYAEIIAEHFGFKRYFTAIIGSELDGRRGKKSEVIEYVLETLDPKRQMKPIMIGDRNYDIIGANETAISSIGVTWGYGSQAELAAAGATFIAGSPGELSEIILRQ